ncbi:hypothetical protein AUO95_11530 [Corynebacterium glutamicum]|nr:hypothetical protein AUO95_11530 [Corynebacterium glutamicum]
MGAIRSSEKPTNVDFSAPEDNTPEPRPIEEEEQSLIYFFSDPAKVLISASIKAEFPLLSWNVLNTLKNLQTQGQTGRSLEGNPLRKIGGGVRRQEARSLECSCGLLLCLNRF